MKEKLRALGDRWPWVGQALDVHQRMGEINGGFMAAAINVSIFVALFPLLLVGIAVVGIVAHNNTDLAGDIIEHLGLTGTAATTMESAITTASNSRQVASIVGLVGLAWAGSGVAVALQQGVRAPWQENAEGVVNRLVAMAWLVIAGLGFAVTLALSSVLNVIPDDVPAWLVAIPAVAVGILAEIALFWWLLWGLGSRRVPPRALLPGAVVGGLGFEVLKLVGTIYVPHLVARTSALYGPIGVVFAILAWLAFFARLVVYSSTLNVVRYEARTGTIEVPIRVPVLPGVQPVAATRGGVMVGQVDDLPSPGA